MSNENTAEEPLTATVGERLGEQGRLDELRARAGPGRARSRGPSHSSRRWWAAGAALGTLVVLDALARAAGRLWRR